MAKQLSITSSVARLNSLTAGPFLGLPQSLILTLTEIYFETAYNANLLLHKQSFLESLKAGTARSHTILSVCALGANFYQDDNENNWLKEHGFMLEWAQMAGKLVLLDAEELDEENIVTFLNLALFWHSQGSWRRCFLHKGNAYQILSITGLAADTITQDSWESEKRRRRLWACYLMHCFNNERLASFEPLITLPNLPLPWSEDDFEAGLAKAIPTTLTSTESNGGIYAELAKALTLWTSITSSAETGLVDRISDIHKFDERISKWWGNVPQHLKLAPTDVPTAHPSWFSKILLLNVLYHQSLCALHASIVPLFCWTTSDESCALARKTSAQIAYDHACSISELIDAVLSHCPKLTTMPAYIPYAAYCGCAIQIPFMWNTDPAVQQRVQLNVKANIKMIGRMAPFWKYADLLRVHVNCLYAIHRRRHVILEGEPLNVDIHNLTGFKIHATYARSSILEFGAVVRNKEGGFAKPGEVADDLGIHDDEAGNESRSRASTWPLDDHDEGPPSQTRGQTSVHNTYTDSFLAVPPIPTDMHNAPQHEEQYHSSGPQQPITSEPQSSAGAENQTLDVFQPFYDPAMLDLFPNGDIPDLSGFDMSPLSFDCFEMDGWQNDETIYGSSAQQHQQQ